MVWVGTLGLGAFILMKALAAFFFLPKSVKTDHWDFRQGSGSLLPVPGAPNATSLHWPGSPEQMKAAAKWLKPKDSSGSCHPSSTFWPSEDAGTVHGGAMALSFVLSCNPLGMTPTFCAALRVTAVTCSIPVACVPSVLPKKCSVTRRSWGRTHKGTGKVTKPSPQSQCWRAVVTRGNGHGLCALSSL